MCKLFNTLKELFDKDGFQYNTTVGKLFNNYCNVFNTL